VWLSQATPSTSGTVVTGHARVRLDAAGSTTVKFAIYADASGEPGDLLAESDVLTLNTTSAGERIFTFSPANQIPIIAGTPYWIGLAWADPGTPGVEVRRDGVTAGRREQVLTWPTLPDPFGTPSDPDNAGPIAAYVTYDEASPEPPGSVFDLSSWKWQGPIEDPNDPGDIIEVAQPELDTYASEYLYLDDQDRMVMVAPVAGFTTGDSARSELREMQGAAEAAWSLRDPEPRSLTVTGYFDPTNVSGGSNPRPEMIIGQIHGTLGSPPLILAAEYHVATPRIRIYKYNGSSTPGFGNMLAGITPTTLATYRIAYDPGANPAGGTGRILIYGAFGDHTALSSTPAFTFVLADFFGQDEDLYFKVGAYPKTVASSGATGEGVTTITRLELIQPGGGGVTFPLGRPSDTSSARPLTSEKQRQIGPASSVSGARPVASGKSATIGAPAETDGARPLTSARTTELGRPSESAGARPLTAAKTATLGPTGTLSATRPLTSERTAALAAAGETDGAGHLAENRGLIAAAETSGTRALETGKTYVLGRVGDTTAALPITSGRSYLLGAAAEQAATRALGPAAKTATLAAAAEAAAARILDFSRLHPLGSAGETDGARAVFYGRAWELGRPFTLEGLRPWTAEKRAGFAPATDLGGFARALLPGKTYALGRAGDTSLTRELSATAFARSALTLALWAVDPDDGTLIPLPHHTKLSVSPTRNSQGSIEVEYPAHGRNAYLLRELADDDRDLEVEIWLHGSREGALRGLLSASSSDDTDEHAVNGYTGTLLEQLLDEVLAWPQPDDEKKELSFVAANAGEMAATVLQQAQARGCLVGVTRDFTTDEDSTGAAWPTTTTVKFSPTTTFLEMLQELVELGMLDAFELTADRVLRLWGPGQYGVDRTVGERPLTFRRGRDLTEAPLRHNVRPAGTTVLAVGAEGNHAEATDPTALARRRRRIEVATTANALKDAGAVEAFAQQSLPTATTGTREVAHGLVVGPGRPRPRKDFERGDWVRSDTAGRIERRRIWQWTLVEDVSGLRGELVVGTPVTDHLQALARQLKRISSGTAVVGTSQPPPADDAVPPAAPTGLVAESTAYQDPTQPMGFTLAQVTLGWAPVTTNAVGAHASRVQAAEAILQRFVDELPIAADWTWDGAPPVVYAHREELHTAWQAAPAEPTAQQWLQTYIDANTGVPTAADDVAGYRVRWAELGLGQVGGIPSSDPFPESNLSYYEATPAEGTTETSWTWRGAPAGANLRLEVQAFDKSGNHGPWAAIGRDTAVDDQAPPTPSGAVGLKTVARTLDVPWDGLGAEGEPMPTDFSHTRIWLSQAASFTVPEEVGSEPTPFNPLQAEPQYVDRLYTAGITNIVGLPYGVGWYVALQTVDHTGNASELSAIVGPVSATQLVQIDIGPNAIGRQQVIDLEVIRAKIANLAVNSAKVEEISAGLVTTGTLLATLTMTGAIQTASTGLRWRGDPAGIRFYNSNNELTIDLRGDSGNVLMTGQIQSALAGARWVMTKEGTLRLYPPSGNNFSEIANRGNDVVWRGPLTNGRSGRVNVNTLGAAINYSAEEDLLENIRAEILVVDRQLRLTAPFINLIVDRRWTSPVGGLVSGRRIQFSHIDDDGDFIERSGVSYITDADGDGGMVGNDAGWKFERNSNGDGRFMLTNGNMTNWGVGQALAWDGPSSREVKKDIADARAVLDPKATIGSARARKFRYNQQRPDEDPYIGVIAEELPEVLQRPMKAPDGTDVIGTDYGSMIGVLWGFANQILDQEIVSTSGTVVLPRSQLGPGGIFPAGATVELPVAWDSKPPAAPTGGFVQLHSSFVWAGRVTAWIKTGSVDQHGATVVFKNISTSNVVVNEATDALRVSATVIGLGLYTPPYVPPEEP
jgi:hypothetical protein